MPGITVGNLLRHLRLLLAEKKTAGQDDRYLLAQFAGKGDEVAFAALMERHGPMVLSVCRRVLGDEHLAEDVFQATFLVLTRKAGTIRNRNSLAGWLHGVALRLARNTLKETIRARKLDVRGQLPPAEPPSEASRHETRTILDDELQRLPDKHRLPLLLCYYEGQTRDEASLQLGWSVGKLKGHLERARERLRSRLLRRGVTLAAAGSATLLTDITLSAKVPPVLSVTTIQTAADLWAGKSLTECGVSSSVAAITKRGLQIMALKKAAILSILILLASAIGTGLVLMAGGDSRFPEEKLGTQQSKPLVPAVKDNPAEPKIVADGDGPMKREPNGTPRAVLVAQTGHDGLISAAAQSADGKWLVTAGYDDSNVKLWDLSTGMVIRTFKMRNPSNFGVTCVALAGNDKWLVATRSFNNLSTQIWELATGKVIYHSDNDGVFAGLSPDGKVLALSAGRYLGNGDDGNPIYPIRLIDVPSGKEIREFRQRHFDALFQPEEKRIILAAKGVLRCLDSDTGKEVYAVHDANLPSSGWQFPIFPFSGTAGFSADGNWLWAVTGTTVRMWDTRSGKMERSFAIPKGVHSARLSANGAWLATLPGRNQFDVTGEDGVSRLWDTKSGKEISTFACHGLLPPEGDGKHVVDVEEVWPGEGRAFNNIVVMESATAKVVRTFFTWPRRLAMNLAISRDGKWLAANDPENTGVVVWDLTKGKQLSLPDNSFTQTGVTYTSNVSRPNPALSGNGKLVAIAKSKAHLWDLTDGKFVHAFDVGRGQVTGNGMEGEGEKFWPHENLTSMTVSQDGKWLAMGVERGPEDGGRWGIGEPPLPPVPVVRLWDLAAGKEVRSFGKDDRSSGKDDFSGKYTRATMLTFLAGDKWLLEGDDYRDLEQDPDNRNPFIYRAKLWEVATGKEVRNFKDISPFAVALTNDGKFLAAAKGHDVVLQDFATGKDVRTFKGHPNDVSSVSFSADGTWLVAGSSDYKWRPPTDKEGNPRRVSAPPWEARVWEVATGKLVNVIRQSNVVIHVSLSRDGKRLLSQSESGHSPIIVEDSALQRERNTDDMIRVWDVASGKLLCRVPRNTWHAGMVHAGMLRPRRDGGILTGDGERLIWLDHDQNIRVLDAASGTELCRIVSFANGTWVVYDAEGRYDSANDGKIEGLHWAVGTETRPFNELRDRYYDPGLLAKYMGFSQEPLRKLDAR